MKSETKIMLSITAIIIIVILLITMPFTGSIVPDSFFNKPITQLSVRELLSIVIIFEFIHRLEKDYAKSTK